MEPRRIPRRARNEAEKKQIPGRCVAGRGLTFFKTFKDVWEGKGKAAAGIMCIPILRYRRKQDKGKDVHEQSMPLLFAVKPRHKHYNYTKKFLKNWATSLGLN